MSMTLAQAVTRVRFLIDDSDDVNPLVSDDEIKAALLTAQQEAWQIAVSGGTSVFTKEVLVTTDNDGLANLSTTAPLVVKNVSWVSGTTRLSVDPARAMDWSATVPQAIQLAISYVPRVTFPVLDGDPFVWAAAAIVSPTLDAYMCALAASEVWIRTGERPLATLEQRKAELSRSLASPQSQTRWSVASVSAQRHGNRRRHGAPWQFVMTSVDQLQLVIPG